jgi:cyclophilin family peptidyl-prolyl cis-trans isomerase/HEAT repeat protein
MIRYLLPALSVLFITSCENESPAVNIFSDDVYVQIAEYQDRRLTDSLIDFFDHENAKYRRAAALAFASIQDTSAIQALGKLFVSDQDEAVRVAAAFALGQTGGNQAFAFLNASDSFDSLIAEALGKTAGNGFEATNLSAWGLYRLALRNLADSTHVSKALTFLESGSEEARLGAAHFLGRGPSVIAIAEQALISVARNDSSVFVRMAAASALRKIASPTVLKALKEIYFKDKDYRVRINALRSLQPYTLQETSEAFFGALQDDNVNVAIAATEVIRQVSTTTDYVQLVEHAQAASNWRVRSNLYEAALAVSGSKELSEEIISRCTASQNPYEKAALIGALGHAPLQFGFVKDQLTNSTIPVIRSSSASALAAMNRHKQFEPSMQEYFLDGYRKALALSDPAVIGIIVAALMDPTLGYKNLITDIQFLYEARQKLALPKDNEALQPLEAAIAYFEGKEEVPPVVNEYNHPIDWNFVKSIPRDQQVEIRTAKGSIEIRLLVEEAPGSVANFLELAQAGYFDSKKFHRVVPNFVIQDGCNRGDGWGSEDYSIRSEFSLRKYKEGSVGMASAGKDTEGTQWFITHSPTPHLDGRYTIFAEVVGEMDVVHRIEVGDLILSVEVVKP